MKLSFSPKISLNIITTLHLFNNQLNPLNAEHNLFDIFNLGPTPIYQVSFYPTRPPDFPNYDLGKTPK